MSLMNHNKSFSNVEWTVNTEGMPYKKCSEISLDTEYKLNGVFTTPDNGYGEGACAILDDCILNLPSRFVSVVNDIRSDEEAIEEIKSGKAYLKVTTFISKKYKKTGYDIEFILK